MEKAEQKMGKESIDEPKPQQAHWQIESKEDTVWQQAGKNKTKNKQEWAKNCTGQREIN